MHGLQPQELRQRLERVLITFFVLAAFSLVVIYAVDPALYTQMLSLPPAASSAYPLPVTLFLVGILGLIAVLIVGIRRHWRWLFWLILVAFGAGVLDILVTPLQLLGALPGRLPVWYSLVRVGVASIQVIIAVWMGRISYQHGVWAMGRKKSGQQTTSGQT